MEQLKAMTTVELEALAYRQLVTIENSQALIKVINQIFTERSQEVKEEPKVETKKK